MPATKREVPIYQDPFNPILVASPKTIITEEQDLYVRRVLETSCSDSRFAQKAYIALKQILNTEPVAPPAITSLNPPSAVTASPPFTLHVLGSGFVADSVISWAGAPVLTTFVSAEELTAEVSVSVVGSVPVVVENPGGVLSATTDFTVTDVVAQVAVKEEVKKEVVKKEVVAKKEEEERKLPGVVKVQEEERKK